MFVFGKVSFGMLLVGENMSFQKWRVHKLKVERAHPFLLSGEFLRNCGLSYGFF